MLEFTPSIAPLFPPCWIHGTVSTGIIFAFTCMCTHFLHYSHPPTPCLYHLPPPTGLTLPLGRTYSTLLFSNFAEEKREKEKHDIFASLR
jgi:hypothetical protein